MVLHQWGGGGGGGGGGVITRQHSSINWVDNNVNWPPLRDFKADVRSVSPLLEAFFLLHFVFCFLFLI